MRETSNYEIELAKRVIKLDLPIQLGVFHPAIRQTEKCCSSISIFMDTYVARSDFEYIEMDTDSAYMALSASCLDDIIRPDHKDKFQRGLSDMCDDSHNSPENRWLPRTCCSKHAKFDKRTPGLFKKEFEGHEW